MMISYKYLRSRHLWGDFFRSLYFLSFMRRWKKRKLAEIPSIPLQEFSCVFDCRLCEEACPASCMKKSAHLIEVQTKACLECSLCFEVCPHKIIVSPKSEEL